MGKTAVVTGGSRGIGKAVALRLAKDGYDIALNYASNDEAADPAKKEITATGVRCEIYKADTSDMAQVKAMFKDIKKEFEQVLSKSEEIKIEEWKKRPVGMRLKQAILHIFAPFM